MARWFDAQPMTDWKPLSFGGNTGAAFVAFKRPVLKSHES
jgi:hypothetical protein